MIYRYPVPRNGCEFPLDGTEVPCSDIWMDVVILWYTSIRATMFDSRWQKKVKAWLLSAGHLNRVDVQAWFLDVEIEIQLCYDFCILLDNFLFG